MPTYKKCPKLAKQAMHCIHYDYLLGKWTIKSLMWSLSGPLMSSNPCKTFDTAEEATTYFTTEFIKS